MEVTRKGFLLLEAAVCIIVTIIVGYVISLLSNTMFIQYQNIQLHMQAQYFLQKYTKYAQQNKTIVTHKIKKWKTYPFIIKQRFIQKEAIKVLYKNIPAVHTVISWKNAQKKDCLVETVVVPWVKKKS